MSNVMDSTTLPANSTDDDDDDGLYVPGLIAVIAFYLVILGVGILASYLKKAWSSNNPEDVILAGRDMGVVVGVFTMTATWVGGGYINGTSEYVYTEGYGLVWCQAPLGYAISLAIGGLIFAKAMRDAGHVTMLDPFRKQYGRVMTSFLFIPALMGDIFWSGAILSALGASLQVIIGLSNEWSIIISAIIAVCYTEIGGLYSVAFTDVIQLCCIFIGLWLAVPFALTDDAVSSITSTSREIDVVTVNGTISQTGWLGSLAADKAVICNYIDSFLLLIFGGIPWQVYFQRVLSQKSAFRAQWLSFSAAIGCLIMAVPAVLIGAIAKSTNWTETEYGKEPTDPKLVLPLVMQYLTPTPVAIIGLGAVSAAVMSSADSSVLSSSSMFAHNIYRPIRDAISSKASDNEVVWVMRGAVLVVGAAATAIAIVVDSVYGLWFLCSDLVYVILFPQLLCVVHLPSWTNTYGSLVGYLVAWFFRLTGGEELVSLPALIEYPFYDETYNFQYFPFKTMTMLISLVTILLFSLIAKLLFEGNVLPLFLDVFSCFNQGMELGDNVSWHYNKGDGNDFSNEKHTGYSLSQTDPGMRHYKGDNNPGYHPDEMATRC